MQRYEARQDVRTHSMATPIAIGRGTAMSYAESTYALYEDVKALERLEQALARVKEAQSHAHKEGNRVLNDGTQR